MSVESQETAPGADLVERLTTAVCGRLGAARVTALRQLSGGASQETWSFDAVSADGTELPLILRRSPTERRGSTSITPRLEARVQQAAVESGVPAAPVRFVLGAEDSLGEGYVMDRLEGESIAPRILRAPELEAARQGLARQCGRILARIHATPVEGLELPSIDGHEQIERYREIYWLSWRVLR